MAKQRKIDKAARSRKIAQTRAAAPAATKPEPAAPRAVAARRQVPPPEERASEPSPRIVMGDERGRSQLRSIRAPKGAWVMVRIAMGTYGDPANGGVKLERDRVFQLAGAAKDIKLVRLGYIVPVEDNGVNPRDCFPCRFCGGLFATLNGLNGHGNREHKNADERPESIELPAKERGANVIEEADLVESQFLQSMGAAEDAKEQAADERTMRETPPYFENTEASAGA